MPPIELGPMRPLGAVDTRLARVAGGRGDTTAKAASAEAPASPGAVLDAGEAPVDVERVAQVRKAVMEGSYPLLPAKVADAIIAAGLLLRSPK